MDLGAAHMRRALRDFSDEVRDADIAVVFYAGHGMEMNGINYLFPVDSVLERDIDVADETVSLSRVNQILEPAKHLRLIILDACRDNPFVRRFGDPFYSDLASQRFEIMKGKAAEEQRIAMLHKQKAEEAAAIATKIPSWSRMQSDEEITIGAAALQRGRLARVPGGQAARGPGLQAAPARDTNKGCTEEPQQAGRCSKIATGIATEPQGIARHGKGISVRTDPAKMPKIRLRRDLLGSGGIDLIAFQDRCVKPLGHPSWREHHGLGAP
jgi:hypothetical protein